MGAAQVFQAYKDFFGVGDGKRVFFEMGKDYRKYGSGGTGALPLVEGGYFAVRAYAAPEAVCIYDVFRTVIAGVRRM